jgi:hypothetical protein
MAEVPNSEEYKVAHAERLNKFNDGVRQFTKGILKEAFRDGPITPEDHIATFQMTRSSEGMVGIFISKPSRDEARDGDEGEENKVSIIIGSIEENHTPFKDRLRLAYLLDRMGEGPKGKMLRNLSSTLYTDKHIATQYTIEELASEQPVSSAREGIDDLTPGQLHEGEKLLATFGGNTSGRGFRQLAIDRW